MKLRSILPPDARLLLTTVLQPDEEEVRDILHGGLSWPLVLESCLREQSMPVSWRRLAPLVSDGMPPEVTEIFDRAATQRELYLTALRSRLVEALEVLTEAGHQVLLLKGAALAHTVHEHFTERPMSDVDLLVAPDAALDAWSKLRERGWCWNEERYPASEYRTSHHLPPLLDRRGTGAAVEIHAGALPYGHGFDFSDHDLFRDAREVQIDGRTAWIPHPLPNMLYTCLHFAWSHRLSAGAWKTCRDVDVLMRQPGFDWDAFLELDRRAGTARCSYWTLRLAGELASLPIPEEVLESLEPPLPGVVRRALSRHFALGLLAPRTRCPSVGLRKALWRLGVHPSPTTDTTPRPTGAQLPDLGRAGSEEEYERRDDGVLAPLWRHVRDRGRWLDYLRRVVKGHPA